MSFLVEEGNFMQFIVDLEEHNGPIFAATSSLSVWEASVKIYPSDGVTISHMPEIWLGHEEVTAKHTNIKPYVLTFYKLMW